MKRLGMFLVTLTLILGLCFGALDDLPLLSPDEVPQNLRSYSIVNNYCWLVAHMSGKIGSKIVIDGGTAKYRLKVNETDVAVPDLNGHTVSLDLSRDFHVNEPKLTILATKTGNTTGNWTTSDAPVVNRGGMWVIGNDTIIQGGHFYTDNRINTSRWHVTKDAIPGYSMWRFTDATNKGKWHEETFHNGTEIIRTVSGASACTNESCYWLG